MVQGLNVFEKILFCILFFFVIYEDQFNREIPIDFGRSLNILMIQLWRFDSEYQKS